MKSDETKPVPADELADAERKRAHQRDVAAAKRLVDQVLWMVFAERRGETLQ
jgi:hypothetical protein